MTDTQLADQLKAWNQDRIALLRQREGSVEGMRREVAEHERANSRAVAAYIAATYSSHKLWAASWGLVAFAVWVSWVLAIHSFHARASLSAVLTAITAVLCVMYYWHAHHRRSRTDWHKYRFGNP
jgi:Flp pilus assembly protein TadB